jgi:two-component system NtrC family sensor kinase
LDNKQLTQELELLKREIKREKKARQLAEQQLETYSREIYQANQSLKDTQDDTNKKQAEIEYLTKASYDFTSELTLFDILKSTVSLTGKFFNAEYGIKAIFNKGKLINDSKNLIWSSGDSWSENPGIKSLFFKNLPLARLPSEQYYADPHWFITQINEGDKVGSQKLQWLVYINLELESNNSVWIGFLTKIECLDEEALHILEVAKGHLLSGIRRRLSDEKITLRNTQLQETAAYLQEARKQLIQSEKMASLGQLAAGVAHEINNPIGYIRSNLQTLDNYLQEFKILFQLFEEKIHIKGSLSKKDFIDITKKKEMDFLLADAELILKSNQEGIERIKEIIEGLKSFSHTCNDDLKKISVSECVENALRIVENEFKYQHKVINTLEATLPKILSNHGKLQQVFVNLLINSAHAMPEGGTVRISSELHKNYLLIHVEDNGIGMDKNTRNQIFNPFFTTKSLGKGTGLGLSISYAILEKQKISIEVKSELGHGSCFTLRFPID